MSRVRFLGGVGCTACLMLLSSSVGSVQAAPLLGLDYGTGALYQVSTDNASLNAVGNTGVQLAALLFGPDDMLYGFTIGSQPKLYRVDPQNAATTLVAPMLANGIFLFEGAMAASPDGVVYGVNFGNRANNTLFTLDLNNGIVTKIAALDGGLHDINGMAWRSDGMLVGLDEAQKAIIEINPATGATSVLFDLASVALNPRPTLGAIGDLTAIGDVGYFSTAGWGANPAGSNELWKLNLFTGAPELIGAFPTGLSSLGIGALAVPEPAMLTLLALASLMLRRRR